MSPGVGVGDHARESFPRVSGDEPAATRARIQLYRFSPRERG